MVRLFIKKHKDSDLDRIFPELEGPVVVGANNLNELEGEKKGGKKLGEEHLRDFDEERKAAAQKKVIEKKRQEKNVAKKEINKTASGIKAQVDNVVPFTEAVKPGDKIVVEKERYNLQTETPIEEIVSLLGKRSIRYLQFAFPGQDLAKKLEKHWWEAFGGSRNTRKLTVGELLKSFKDKAAKESGKTFEAYEAEPETGKRVAYA